MLASCVCWILDFKNDNNIYFLVFFWLKYKYTHTYENSCRKNSYNVSTFDASTICMLDYDTNV